MSGVPSETVRERFIVAVAETPELAEAFGTLGLLARAAHLVDAPLLAAACEAVALWADERSLLRTATQFAEAAAYTDAANPYLSNAAARFCRRSALMDRAAVWYERAFYLSRGTRDNGESLRALLGFGSLMKDQGRYKEAQRYLGRAARRAERTGRRRQAAEAHHNLLGIAAEIGSFADAEWHVRQAIRLYPVQHPRMPALVHDWAFLLTRHRLFTPALRAAQLAEPQLHRPEAKLICWGTIARAAAGAAKQEIFEEAVRRALPLLALYQEYAGGTLIHLAEGSRYFGRWDRPVTMRLRPWQSRGGAATL
jgi:tetratricopeptide (TPR) repeat protein